MKTLKILAVMVLVMSPRVDSITDGWYCWVEGDRVECSEVVETEPEGI